VEIVEDTVEEDIVKVEEDTVKGEEDIVEVEEDTVEVEEDTVKGKDIVEVDLPIQRKERRILWKKAEGGTVEAWKEWKEITEVVIGEEVTLGIIEVSTMVTM